MFFRNREQGHGRQGRSLLAFLAATIGLIAITAPAIAQKRILIVGDSWAEQTWDQGAWPAVLNTYGLSQWSAEGETTAIGGTTASVWRDPGALALIEQALTANPTIDVVHLSISGNDMLLGQAAGGWHTGLSAPQESALFDQIQANVTTIVDFCLGVRPEVKVALVDYDYLNLWETSLDGIQGAQLSQLNLGNPSPSQVNAAFTNMGLRKRAIANSRSRVLYVHNWGLQQYRHGHPGFWDAGLAYRLPFSPASVPLPGWPPSYSPYPGGNSVYPSPRAALANNGDDPIHLNATGYKDVCSSALGQGVAGWLTDLSGPTVLSLVRKAGAQNPTANQTLEFTITFSEDIRTLAASDFAFDASPTITGASVTGVSGSGTVRTVTVNRGTGEGQISIDFIDHDTVYDLNWRAAGNNGVPPSPGDASYNNGEYYLIDEGPPSVTVTPGIVSPTFLTSAPFTANFSEPVTGFTSGDIQLAVTGPGTAQVTSFAGGPSAYTFNVLVTRTGSITVNVGIPAGVAVDALNNPNTPGSHDGFQFDMLAAPGGDPYLSNGSLGNLILSSGTTLTFYTGVGASPPTYRINSNPSIQGELIDVSPVGAGELVAKFNFVEVNVPAGVTVNLTGDNPIAIAATEDIIWDAPLDVSGEIAGRAGGGRGGGGGAGGAGGGGGGTGGGGGGAGRAGGGGGVWAGDGSPGGGRNNGTAGNSGLVGVDGGFGTSGDPGTNGFRAQGGAGGGGGGGSRGTGKTTTNNGDRGAASGGGGGGGAVATGLPLDGVAPGGGGGTVNGVDGGNASQGAAGGNGGNGSPGTDASFGGSAIDLTLAGGPGGGGGGGGGGGAGGQGGGKGGGGSSGAGGGGGGGIFNSWATTCAQGWDCAGGGGGYGGAGGAGGDGGKGGTAGKARTGGAGGNGGGVAVLAARGLLDFGGTMNVSAGSPGDGGTAVLANAGGSYGDGTDPQDNWEGGGGGSGGGTGGWWTFFYVCLPIANHGGTGGSGTRGGAGGNGGRGGDSGTSGAGGSGGLAAPGMVKLHSSVILTSGGSVTCDNHSAISTSDLTGRYTSITNMASPGLPSFSDHIVTGTTTNNPILRAPAPYSASIDVPLIPQLEGGTATGGFCEPTFWNQGSVSPPGVDRLELVNLGNNTPFTGFKQIFLVNNGGGDATDVVLRISNSPVQITYNIGTIPSGKIWTTCVPNARTATVDVGMDILVTPAVADLYENESLTLTATVDGGSGSKIYTWLLNESLAVQVGSSNVYEVVAVSELDEGTYDVFVNDQTHPEAGDNNSVVIVDPPVSISVPPVGAALIAGESHVFTVLAQGGKGALHYDWRKNGGSLGAADSPFLDIGPVAGADSGDYDVVVTDSLGAPPYGEVITAPVTISVSTPLAVTGPNDAVVYVDTPATQFQIITEGGIVTYSYIWSKDGVLLQDLVPPIAQPGSEVFTLSPPYQPGDYVCAVTDSDVPPTTLNSGEGRLTVYEHLEITKEPIGVGVNPGQTVTLAVVAEGGIQPLLFTWRMDGVPLAPERQPGGPVLVLSNVSETDEGDYDVVVEDSGTDSETSDLATVIVRDSALVFTTNPQGVSRYIDEGDYSMTAATSGGEGAVTLEWWFDNGLGGGPIALGAGGGYTIANPAVSNSGDYWCTATDSVGAVDSDIAEMLFGERMHFDSQPRGGSVRKDQDFPFSVVVSGGLRGLTYEWKRDTGAKIVESVGIDSPEYTLENAQLDDSGEYWVEVTDTRETEVSDTATLEVVLGVPLGGLLGLSALAAALALVGATRLRKHRQV